MKLSNWQWAVLVFLANLGVMWLFGPSHPATVRAAGPTPPVVKTSGGIANYLPLWLTDNTLGSSTIYEHGGNVGIGTASPGANLEVAGTAKFDGSVNFAGGLSVPASGLTGIVQIANGGTGIDTAPTGAAGQYLRSDGSGNWAISTIQGSDVPTGNDYFSAVTGGIPQTFNGTASNMRFPQLSAISGWTANAENTSFTVSAPGLYLCLLNVTLTINSSLLIAQIQVNNIPILGGGLDIGGASVGTQTGSSSLLIPLQAGDTLSVSAGCSTPSCTLSPNASSTLTMVRIQ